MKSTLTKLVAGNLFLLALLAATGCARPDDAGHGRLATATAQTATYAAARAPASSRPPGQFLAVERSLSVEAADDEIALLYKAAQDTCNAASIDGCIVLESILRTGAHPSANLKFRAKPPAIETLVATLSTRGRIASQATTTDDLAAPVEDSEKRLTMLRDYQSRLEALRGRAAGDIDALIKISKELAQVQSDIEARTGERAQLLRRVETQTLSVSIDSTQVLGFWKPIALALAAFSSDAAEGVASVIVASAFLIPWAFALLALAWIGRKLWCRWRAGRSTTEPST